MSAVFASASSQKLLNSTTPITGYPLTVGAWIRYDSTAATQMFWSIADTGSTSRYFALGWGSAGNFQQRAGTRNTNIAGTPTIGAWYYYLGRFISATNRRLSLLSPGGSVQHAQDTGSNTPDSLDVNAIGCLNHSSPQLFLDGAVAEWWVTNTDVQADGAETANWLVCQLAYGGPFSVPHIAKSLVDYRSLWQSTGSDTDTDDAFIGGLGPQTWVNTNGVTLGPHPPLPYWHNEPRPQTGLVMI